MGQPAFNAGGVGDSANAQNSQAASAFNHTAGRPIRVACQVDTVDVSGVTDTAGNGYTKVGSTYTGGGANQSWWESDGANGNEANVVTQTHVGGAWPRIVAFDLTEGVTDTTYTPAGNQDSSSPFTTTAANTADANTLILGQFSNRISGGAMSSSAPSVFRLETASQDFGVATNEAAAAGAWSVAVASASPTETHSCFAIAIKGASSGAASSQTVENNARRNKPGRGPYSLGRYFRPSLDAFASAVSQSASGQTLTSTAALIAGTATAASTAPAPTLAATSSLLVGTATASSTATGQTLGAATSLTAGIAAAASTAGGQTLTAVASLIAGSATGTGDGTAPSATLTAPASLLAGSATAASAANGVTLAAAASLLPGSASGSSAGTAAGSTLTASSSLVAGAAQASSVAVGQTLAVTASLITGAASGGSAGTAAGMTRVITASLLAGSVAADSVAQGALLVAAAQLVAGSAQGLVPPTWPGGGTTRVGPRVMRDSAERIGRRTARRVT